MPNHSLAKRAQTTPAALYSEKYAWLMRWALHFCNKDRSAAEDLVQDVFMQMLVSWPTFQDAEEPEKLLYTYLKFSFLLKCRKDRRYSFQTLSAIDFESLHLSLRRESFAHSIDVQDGLRRIVNYLNWRKQQAKAASVLLLRFFHGFFPSEIMQIAILTRRSVDTGLAQAREEAKRYLSDPSKLQAIFRGAPPAPLPSQPVLAPEAFVAALRKAVFDSGYGECLPEMVLRERYLGPSPRAIECDLLAHIVSCRKCLNLVTKWCKLPSLDNRLPEEAWGFAPKEKLTYEPAYARVGLKQGFGMSDGGKRAIRRNEQALFSMRGGTQRFLVAHEHQPKALLIAVDGQVLASRDISSATSQLNIELPEAATKELIEVMSEQELPLLTVPVLFKPGEGPPFLEQESTLKSGQRIHLMIRFMARGMLLEVEYFDPSFSLQEAEDLNSAESVLFAMERSDAPVSATSQTAPAVREHRELFPAIKKNLSSAVDATRSFASRMNGAFALRAGLATCVVVAGVVIGSRWIGHPALPPVHTLLQKAANEGAAKASAKAGVIVQSIHVHAKSAVPHADFNRQLSRDARGHKRSVTPSPTGEQKRVAAKLAAADVSWDDPLSAANYRDWHDHASITKDQVEESANGNLVLTSFVSGNTLVSESLTVRSTDFHPIARTVDYVDHEEIEIAEVDYKVIPWSEANPHWFEPEAAPADRPVTMVAHPLLKKPAVLPTTEQLDEAELGARLGLAEVKADGGERVQISRAADGVHIDGLVADERRKRQIMVRLAQIPHTIVNVRTFEEFEHQQLKTAVQPQAAGAAIVVAPQETGQSPLERLLQEQGKPAGETGKLAHELFANSVTLQQSASALDDLERRFQPSTLTPEAAHLLSQLRETQFVRFKAAVAEQSKLLHVAGFTPSSIPDRQASAQHASAESSHISTFSSQAAVHAKLCTELVSQSQSSSRAPQAILSDMAQSLLSLETLAEQHDARQAQRDFRSALGITAPER